MDRTDQIPLYIQTTTTIKTEDINCVRLDDKQFQEVILASRGVTECHRGRANQSKHILFLLLHICMRKQYFPKLRDSLATAHVNTAHNSHFLRPHGRTDFLHFPIMKLSDTGRNTAKQTGNKRQTKANRNRN